MKIDKLENAKFKLQADGLINTIGGRYYWKLEIWEWYEKLLLCMVVLITAIFTYQFYKTYKTRPKSHTFNVCFVSGLSLLSLFVLPFTMGGDWDIGVFLVGFVVFWVIMFTFASFVIEILWEKNRRRLIVAAAVVSFCFGAVVSHLYLELKFLSTERNIQLIFIYGCTVLTIITFLEWLQWERRSYQLVLSILVGFLLGFIIGERGDGPLFDSPWHLEPGDYEWEYWFDKQLEWIQKDKSAHPENYYVKPPIKPPKQVEQERIDFLRTHMWDPGRGCWVMHPKRFEYWKNRKPLYEYDEYWT